METGKFLQSQDTLLEIQAGLFKLNVISTVGNFLKHDSIGRNIEERDDSENELIAISIT